MLNILYCPFSANYVSNKRLRGGGEVMKIRLTDKEKIIFIVFEMRLNLMRIGGLIG